MVEVLLPELGYGRRWDPVVQTDDRSVCLRRQGLQPGADEAVQGDQARHPALVV